MFGIHVNGVVMLGTDINSVVMFGIHVNGVVMLGCGLKISPSFNTIFSY